MSEPAHSALFENAIHVKALSLNTYEGYLDPAWCIGLVPHGGYTTSILYRTAALHFQNKSTRPPTKRIPKTGLPEPISLQITFLRRTAIGRAVLTVQDIKLGARLSTIHITLSQQSDTPTKGGESGNGLEVKLAAYITVSPPSAEEGPVITGPWGLSPPPPRGSLADGSVDLNALAETGRDGSWARIPPTPKELAAGQQIELYAPVDTFSPNRTVKDRGNQVVDQWGRFAPGGKAVRWSNEALVYLLDLFPAALNRIGAMEESRLNLVAAEKGEAEGGGGVGNQMTGRFWYPTVTMNIDLKARIPEEGVEWLHERVVTRMVRGARADLDVVVLDAEGALVATSSQVALVVDPARNTKGRDGAGRL
ncbi:thioesterase-like superfamily-domain-containing protein [Aspergillus californicus]